jgi:ribosomal protein S18 acetylase RimI-like enzyme
MNFLQGDLLLRTVRTVEPNPDQIRALGRFMLDAWKRAGPGAFGWTGATEDTIQEISSEKYLKGLVSNPKMKFFLSEENGEITGFAVNRVQDSYTMELAGIIVREDLLGKGIGSLLISKCIDSARDAGFASMIVKTETSNEYAISFYVKKGFVRIGNVVETVENSKVELAVLRLVL